MTEFDRRKMEKQVLFEEGVEKIKQELTDCALFDDYIIGHVNREMKMSMMETLMTSDEEELIEALVSICIKFMNRPAEPTPMEVVRKQFMLEAEVNVLKSQNKQLADQLKINVAALKTLRDNNLQRALVKHGKKIAYKDNVRPGEVLDHLMDGLPVSKIAEDFGVSRNLIYRRINELKEAGIDVDALRKKK